MLGGVLAQAFGILHFFPFGFQTETLEKMGVDHVYALLRRFFHHFLCVDPVIPVLSPVT